MSAPADCYHCGEPVPDGLSISARVGDTDHPMCCVGCKAVAEFIDSSGLNAFYKYRDRPDTELNLTPEESDWLRFDSDDLLNRYVFSDDGRAEATLDIGGMYCSACVWLFDNALRNMPGIDKVDVNPATRRAVVRWQVGALKFSELLGAISRVGFKPSPVAAGESAARSDDEYKREVLRFARREREVGEEARSGELLPSLGLGVDEDVRPETCAGRRRHQGVGDRLRLVKRICGRGSKRGT